MNKNMLKKRLLEYKVDKARYELLKLRQEQGLEIVDNLSAIEYAIKEIDILINALTSSEKEFLELRFMDKVPPNDILDKLYISEATLNRRTKSVIEKMLNIYNQATI